MTTSKQHTLLFFIGCLVAVALGSFLGLLTGMLFGGMATSVIDIPNIYGGLPGYEGTGALGLVLGGPVLIFAWIRARLRRKIRRNAYLILLVTTIINLLIQNYLWTRPEWKFFLFLPAIAQIFLLALHSQDEFSDL